MRDQLVGWTYRQRLRLMVGLTVAAIVADLVSIGLVWAGKTVPLWWLAL